MRNAAPLKFGILPPALEKFRNKCTAKDKFEQLANILLLARDTDTDLLLAAVDYANKTGLPSFSKVKLFLDMNESTAKPSTLEQIIIEHQELEQYDTLLGMEEYTDE
jgi:hypothetical protein